MIPDIEVCFVYFRSTDLTHLDAAWYSLSRQDFSRVKRVWFLDNNTEDAPCEIQAVLDRYPIPVPLMVSFEKHGDLKRTHSWSANRVNQAAEGPWIFFTRSDYVLEFIHPLDCIARMAAEADFRIEQGQRPFISGWCWQMAYDREARNYAGWVDIEQYDWRTKGVNEGLLAHPYAFRFHETDQDAGVYLTRREYMAEAGWMNEQLSSWGYQQSTFQRALKRKNVLCHAVKHYLFAHLHHAAPRDFEKAQKEYTRFGEGV